MFVFLTGAFQPEAAAWTELQAIIISFWGGEWGVMLYVFPALKAACCMSVWHTIVAAAVLLWLRFPDADNPVKSCCLPYQRKRLLNKCSFPLMSHWLCIWCAISVLSTICSRTKRTLMKKGKLYRRLNRNMPGSKEAKTTKPPNLGLKCVLPLMTAYHTVTVFSISFWRSRPERFLWDWLRLP